MIQKCNFYDTKSRVEFKFTEIDDCERILLDQQYTKWTIKKNISNQKYFWLCHIGCHWQCTTATVGGSQEVQPIRKHRTRLLTDVLAHKICQLVSILQQPIEIPIRTTSIYKLHKSKNLTNITATGQLHNKVVNSRN